MFVACLDRLYDIAKRLAYEGKLGALVGIDSTVTRGTSAKIAKMLLRLPCRIPEKKHQKNSYRIGCPRMWIAAMTELADFFRYCAKIWQVWANRIDAK
jgi:hypothetical protein